MKYKYFNYIIDKKWCKLLIEKATSIGFKNQKVYNRITKKHQFSAKRKSFVVKLIDDIELKNYIKLALIKYNLEIFKSIQFIDHIRIIKYNKGGYFKLHQDKKQYHEKMFNYTMLIYLNDDYIGGNTLILNNKTKQLFSIKKNIGSILLFDPQIIHSGSKLKNGNKYILSVPVYLDKKIIINT